MLIYIFLVLGLDQGVDVLLSVTKRTALNEVLELSSDTPAAGWVRKLEWPEEVRGLLEVWTNGVDLVDQVLHTDDTILAQVLLNDSVVRKGNTLLVDLTVTTLVKELTDGGEVWITVGNVWLDDSQKLGGGLGQSDEDTAVDLVKSQKLQDLSRLRSDLVDTLDSDSEDKLVLSWDEELTLLLSFTLESDLLTLLVTVFLDILLSTLKDDLSLLLVSSLLLSGSGLLLGLKLLSVLSLLQESLRWQNGIVGRNGGGWHFRRRRCRRC